MFKETGSEIFGNRIPDVVAFQTNIIMIEVKKTKQNQQ